MESGNGTTSAVPALPQAVKSGSNRLRSSSKKVSTAYAPYAAAGGTAPPPAPSAGGPAATATVSLATTPPTTKGELSRSGTLVERSEKSKQVVKKEKKEKKAAARGEMKKSSTTTTSAEMGSSSSNGPSGPPLLYFSASAVPTVTHPEIPSQLDKFLVTPGMDVVDGLVSRLRVEDMSDVCSDLSTIFEVHGQTRRLIQWAVRKELAATTNSSSESTLFRQTGVATCMVSIECKRKGGEYLVALLRPFIQKICSETKSMEVDPLRVRSASSTAAAEDLESNRRRLVEASQDAFDLIFASASSFPEALKHTFLIAHNEILQKLPNMRWTAISNFYFLRFVAPALVSPKASGVYEGNPSPQALRALMLISKTLSNAANGVPFGDKEGYMAIMNSVILDNQPRMRAFLEKLIGVADTDSPDTQATLATFPLQTDLHTARCRLLAALYSNRNAVLPALMNTPTPVPGWTPPARMSLSGNSASVATRGDIDRKNSEPVAPTNDRDDKSTKGTLGEMLGQLLDAYRVHCPDWVSDEDKETKKRVQDELIERFEEGLSHTMRPVTPLSIPSGRLYRLLLDVEKQRTKELEEELRIIKLKLHTETQAKRDLQLQILRGNNAPASNGPSAGWVRERQRVAGQFVQMYDMLSTFRGRIVDLERLVLNEAATEGGSGGSVPSINLQQGQGWSDQATSQSAQAAAGGMLSPRSRARMAGKDKAKAQKRRSWNLKLGNPLIHNP